MPIPEELPLLGGLLRLARQEMLDEITRGFEKAGFGDITTAQFAVCQQLGSAPAGKRLTELAAYAGLTKPSTSALVDALERAGYVERVPDPDDGRAQRIRYTARGWAFGEAAVQEVRRVERLWAERIGQERLEQLRGILCDLLDTRLAAAE